MKREHHKIGVQAQYLRTQAPKGWVANVDDPNWDGKIRDSAGDVVATPANDEAAIQIIQAVKTQVALIVALKTALSYHMEPDGVTSEMMKQLMAGGIAALEAAGEVMPWAGEFDEDADLDAAEQVSSMRQAASVAYDNGDAELGDRLHAEADVKRELTKEA